jgi:hypothetical protein
MRTLTTSVEAFQLSDCANVPFAMEMKRATMAAKAASR